MLKSTRDLLLLLFLTLIGGGIIILLPRVYKTTEVEMELTVNEAHFTVHSADESNEPVKLIKSLLLQQAKLSGVGKIEIEVSGMSVQPGEIPLNEEHRVIIQPNAQDAFSYITFIEEGKDYIGLASLEISPETEIALFQYEDEARLHLTSNQQGPFVEGELALGSSFEMIVERASVRDAQGKILADLSRVPQKKFHVSAPPQSLFFEGIGKTMEIELFFGNTEGTAALLDKGLLEKHLSVRGLDFIESGGEKAISSVNKGVVHFPWEQCAGDQSEFRFSCSAPGGRIRSNSDTFKRQRAASLTRRLYGPGQNRKKLGYPQEPHTHPARMAVHRQTVDTWIRGNRLGLHIFAGLDQVTKK